MKQRFKRTIGLLIGIISMCSCFTAFAADEQVKISDKEYLVSIQEAGALFISNEKPVSTAVGTKVFLTYTVEKVTRNEATQSGVIGTEDNTQPYPYQKNGRMEYTSKSLLFEEGYTYVYRFEKTEKGFEYECAKLKGDEAVNINFSNVAKNGDSSTYQHYGIWMDVKSKSKVTAMLNHVRCYDEQGNDLGLHFNKPTASIQNEANKLLDVHHRVNTNYSFSFEKASSIAIGSKFPTDSDVVYMEYELEDVALDNTTQQGAMVTKAVKPESGNYPHGNNNGKMLYKQLKEEDKDRPLLTKGAKYFICFAKKDDGFNVYVQRTINGKTDNLSLPYSYGTYNPEFQHFALWFGDGSSHPFSASFKNFKCYDAKGNNLGVQINKSGTSIYLHGEPEDYSKTQAVYYCKENNGFIVLLDGKKATKQLGGEKADCTYRIMDREELYLSYKGGKETYNYTTLLITDENDNQYKRMKDTTVTFVTGDETIKAKATAENGYRVEEPKEPVKKDNKFKGWFLSDGTAYDFDTVVTEALTLYAKWKDGDGNEYLAQAVVNEKVDKSMVISIVASVAILTVVVAGCVVIVRKGKKHGRG